MTTALTTLAAQVDPCVEYGLALAAEDFVPVVLAGIGCLVLAQAVGRVLPRVGPAALLGGVLVTLGGLSKALWKLLVAAEPCRDYPILEQLLFPCLSVGFALLAWALLSARRGRPAPAWPFVAVVLAGAMGAVLAGGMMPLLGVAALGAVTVAVVAASWARSRGDRVAVLLFVAYVVGTLVLPPLAARPDQSEALQWAEQLTNTVVQACFLLGSLRLRRGAPAPVPEPTRTTGVNA